ncbi:NAD(P)/FAD-dependent oxidoreductase [Aurantibacter aestuarii]|uniref:FAD-dependent oxidoreductase n=1 Tax=Aurantibacter aestuarii TaxID=1266046 RepID=A0A2T1NEN1_9FLAO|nr:FAD-binding oxidoreductase [Aurantibacter aestuarii]PSG90859.1 FAD-dependent oxidoreductase [Aurantibacter aestuarii]
MNVDYIIVGCGLAGIAFCEQLKTHHKSFVVFDNDSQQASTVAGGLYNPVVLKRFTAVWKSEEQLKLALPLYAKIEKDLQQTFDYKVPVHRLFKNLEEQNDWFTASDQPRLEHYLSTTLIKNNNNSINADLGYGEVLQTGRIDTKALISAYKKDLKQKEILIEEAFQYEKLESDGQTVQYKDITAKQIVFAEGYGLNHNPFFNYLPLNGTKGELLTIKAPDLNLNEVVKSSVFLIPLGEDLYRVGSTYNWSDKTNLPTEEAKTELLEKLKSIITCNFEVVKQSAGIRPTTVDRRPFVGEHLEFKNHYVLNGLGTRGVMIAPFVAKALFDHIEHGKKIDQEIWIHRFKKYKYV